MRKFLIALFCIVISVPISACGDPVTKGPQQGYTTTTLREPIFDAAQISIGTVRINNWLNANYGKLNDQQITKVRERIYYLIDSQIKGLYARESKILPEDHDLILEILFSWAERLGVYGGALAYNAVKSPKSTKMETQLNVPDKLFLRLDTDLFTLGSKVQGWEVKIPYYFMIWRLDNFTTTIGQRTQIVALSTGAALDQSSVGHSQATVMLMFSPDADFHEFSDFWKKAVGVGKNTELISLGVAGRESFHSMDTEKKLHKEITTWKETQGAVAVAYLGMDGTYQWNRPHFLDFLRSLKFRRISSPN